MEEDATKPSGCWGTLGLVKVDRTTSGSLDVTYNSRHYIQCYIYKNQPQTTGIFVFGT